MERERYLTYIPPDKPVVEWTNEELFDEVDFIATHRIEVRSLGERDIELKRRMGRVTFEQMARYSETHA